MADKCFSYLNYINAGYLDVFCTEVKIMERFCKVLLMTKNKEYTYMDISEINFKVTFSKGLQFSFIYTFLIIHYIRTNLSVEKNIYDAHADYKQTSCFEIQMSCRNTSSMRLCKQSK